VTGRRRRARVYHHSCRYAALARDQRLAQILTWFARGAAGGGGSTPIPGGDGLLIFDEAHKAKNLFATPPSKAARAVETLQKRLTGARVVYASATGASEATHMAYMMRLGLWGNNCGAHAEARTAAVRHSTAQCILRTRRAHTYLLG
jgi:hypothetical protein